MTYLIENFDKVEKKIFFPFHIFFGTTIFTFLSIETSDEVWRSHFPPSASPLSPYRGRVALGFLTVGAPPRSSH
jgi:hypothetical protein